MNYYIGSIVVTPYLEHHGILGMKWGKRNGPPYPLDAEGHSKAEKKAGWRKSLGKTEVGKAITKRIDKSIRKHEKFNNLRKELQNKDKKDLTSSEKIFLDSERKAKILKVAAITGGVALTAIAGYSLYNQYKTDKFDTIINSGVELSRLTTNANTNLDKPFYAALKEESYKYVGLLGPQKQLQGQDTFKVAMTVTKDIKVPNREHVENAFMDLYKNDESFKRNLNSLRGANAVFGVMNPKIGKIIKNFEQAQKAHNESGIRKFGYDLFNFSMCDHGYMNQTELDKFYDKLKAMGYNAVIDVNDQKYSDYNTKKPLIIFDVGSVTKNTVERVGGTEIAKAIIPANAELITKVVATTAPIHFIGAKIDSNTAAWNISRERAAAKRKERKMQSNNSEGNS